MNSNKISSNSIRFQAVLMNLLLGGQSLKCLFPLWLLIFDTFFRNPVATHDIQQLIFLWCIYNISC